MVNRWVRPRVLLVSLTAIMVLIAGVPRPVCACQSDPNVQGETRAPGSCPCRCEGEPAPEPTAPKPPAPEKKTGCCCTPTDSEENKPAGTKTESAFRAKPSSQLAKKSCIKTLSAGLTFTPGAAPAVTFFKVVALLPALPSAGISVLDDCSSRMTGFTICFQPPPTDLLILLQHFLI